MDRSDTEYPLYFNAAESCALDVYKRQKKTPSIETIIVKTVNATLDVDMLVNGEVDIVQGVVEGDKIEKAKAAENVQESTYARNGFGNVPMHKMCIRDR